MFKQTRNILLVLVSAVAMLFAGVATTSCVLTNPDSGTTEPSIDNFCKSMIAQGVYSSMKSKPETYEKVWDATLIALNILHESIDLTPAEISNKVTEEISTRTDKDYSLFVQGLLQRLFMKKNIGWSDKIDKEQAKHILELCIEAINLGLDRYKEAYAEVIGAMPSEMPNDPYLN